MKNIEQISLDNMVLIDRYLEQELSAQEKKAFEKRLRSDEDLMSDFLLVKEILEKEVKRNPNILKPKNLVLENVFAEKERLGQELNEAGFVMMLFSIVLIMTCMLIISFFVVK